MCQIEALLSGRAMFSTAAALSALAATAPAAPGGDPAAALVISDVALSTPFVLRAYSTTAAGSRLGRSVVVEIRRDNHGAARLTSLASGGSSVVHVSGVMSHPAAARDEQPRYQLVTAGTLRTTTAAAAAITATTAVAVEEKTVVEQRQAVLASAAMTVFSFSSVSDEASLRAAAAMIQAPCREPGWVDPEVSDAALHLVTAIAADAADLRDGKGIGGVRAARVPAAIAGCCFQRPNATRTGAGLDTVKGPSWPTAAARLLSEQAGSRSQVSDHVLVGGGGEGGSSALITVSAMLVKPMGGAGVVSVAATGSMMGGASGLVGTATERAVRQPAVSLRHEVSWAVTPGDVRRRRDKHDNNTITKETTSFVALPPFLSAATATNAAPTSARRHTSSAVALDLAAALALSQGAVLARTLSTGLRVGTVGSAPGSATGGGATETVQSRDEWAAAAAVRGAALHAVARTLAQEMPGLDGAAVDSDPADVAIFGGHYRGGPSGRRSTGDEPEP